MLSVDSSGRAGTCCLFHLAAYWDTGNFFFTPNLAIKISPCGILNVLEFLLKNIQRQTFNFWRQVIRLCSISPDCLLKTNRCYLWHYTNWHLFVTVKINCASFLLTNSTRIICFISFYSSTLKRQFLRFSSCREDIRIQFLILTRTYNPLPYWCNQGV